MTKHPQPYVTLADALKATGSLWVQPALPGCLDVLPKLIVIEGQGSGRQDPPPLASAEEPANEE